MTEATTTDGPGATEVTGEVTTETTPAAPEWMAGLPDELKSDATLSRYADVPALAKAHIEAHKVAKSKVIVPGADADDAQLSAFYDAIGRPASPDDYDLAMPELPVDASAEDRAALAEGFKPYRELAHQLGLTPKQARALSEFDIKRSADWYAKGAEEVAAVKEEMKQDYAPKLAAGQKIFAKLAGNDAETALLAQELDRKMTSGRLVKFVMRLGEIAGEHGLIESDTVEGFGDVADAEAKLNELQGDKTWRDRLNAGDVTVKAQRDRLLDLAKKQAMRRTGTSAE
jgi:hypothetical protein